MVGEALQCDRPSVAQPTGNRLERLVVTGSWAYWTRRSADDAGHRLSIGAEPFIDLPMRFFAGDAVALLDNAGQFVPTAGNFRHLIIRQRAPFLPNAAFHLVPVTFDLIPIHRLILLLVTAVRGSGGRGHRIRLLAYC